MKKKKNSSTFFAFFSPLYEKSSSKIHWCVGLLLTTKIISQCRCDSDAFVIILVVAAFFFFFYLVFFLMCSGLYFSIDTNFITHRNKSRGCRQPTATNDDFGPYSVCNHLLSVFRIVSQCEATYMSVRMTMFRKKKKKKYVSCSQRKRKVL